MGLASLSIWIRNDVYRLGYDAWLELLRLHMNFVAAVSSGLHL